MNLVYANPLTLGLHYLLLLFTGTSIDKLQDQFYESVNNLVKGAEPTQEQIYDFVVGMPSEWATSLKNTKSQIQFLSRLQMMGGGTTGAVVASRLSENRNFSVLLIEAGSFPFPLTMVPALGWNRQGMLWSPRMNWHDKHEPQKYFDLARDPKRMTYKRPKVLGGGSVVNYMFSMRGSPKSYDRWADVTEDPSWNYENVLPYFKKMENYNGPYKNEKYHSTSGPMSVELKPYPVPLTEEFLKAAKELGFGETDPNGDANEGIYRYATATKNGRRWSTNDGYIYPAILRPNFQIEINSEVTQILLSPDNQVEGVVYVKRNQTYTVKVRKEVIVSSGALGSPKILLQSGIGPKDHLKSVGVPVKVDLPGVGQNLQDHLAVMFGPFIYNKTKSVRADLHESDENPLKSVQDFITSGKGPLSHTGTSLGGDFVSSMGQPGHPDFAFLAMLLPVILGEETSNLAQHFTDIRPGLMQKYMKNDHGKDAFFLTVTLLLPQSQGEVKLRSSNPLDRPIIDPKHLAHEQDLKVLVEGLQLMLKFINSGPFKSVDASLISTPFPGCEAHGADLGSDAYLSCYVEHVTVSYLHYASSCAMGKKPSNPADTPASVVDSKLRVHGVKGVRVADASIMPYVVNTNTNVPCIMIGEKAADEIKRSWAEK